MTEVITVNESQTIVVEGELNVIETRTDVVIIENGDTGPQGAAGPPGIDGIDGTDGIDATFSQSFSSTDTINITHNLGKYPSVTIFDTAGDELEGYVRHTDVNNLVIIFSAFTSGTVTCN